MSTTVFAGGEWLHNGHDLQHDYSLLGCLSYESLDRLRLFFLCFVVLVLLRNKITCGFPAFVFGAVQTYQIL